MILMRVTTTIYTITWAVCEIKLVWHGEGGGGLWPRRAQILACSVCIDKFFFLCGHYYLKIFFSFAYSYNQ